MKKWMVRYTFAYKDTEFQQSASEVYEEETRKDVERLAEEFKSRYMARVSVCTRVDYTIEEAPGLGRRR